MKSTRDPILLAWVALLLIVSTAVLILCLGCAPKEKTLWVPVNTPLPVGMVKRGPVPMTGSMRPVIFGGEYYYAEPPGVLEVGQIVEVNTYYGWALHRITAINETHVYTSGDANRESDRWSKKSDVRYIVRYILRPE